MIRDPNIIRAVLKTAEQRAPLSSFDLTIEGVPAAQVQYHCKLLFEAGYLDCRDESTLTRFKLVILGLTWKAHDLLEAIRDDVEWRAIWAELHARDHAVPFSVFAEFAMRRARRRVIPEPEAPEADEPPMKEPITQ